MEIVLKKIGESVSNMGEELFNTYFGDIETQQKFPLLVGLNNQAGNPTYSETIKDFATLIRLKSGPEAYELLCENLPFPATSTINSYLIKYEHINEGQLQVSSFFNIL